MTFSGVFISLLRRLWLKMSEATLFPQKKGTHRYVAHSQNHLPGARS